MTEENALQHLEKIVVKLLGRYEGLQKENKRLENVIEENRKTIADLQSSLSEKDSERSEIGERVTRIVSQIEQWEESLETISESESSEENNTGQDVEEVETDFEAADEDYDSEETLDSAGRVQHNLF